MKLTIGYFYPNLLNLYGDHGNVDILCYRARMRGITVEVMKINEETVLTDEMMKECNLIFMGGGPDAAQETMYRDLIEQKGYFLKKYVHDGGVGLLICGSYQLFGQYYIDADGKQLDGLGIFDITTRHFGKAKKRCIGNVVATLDSAITTDPVFQSISPSLSKIVGFENHGGRTYLGKDISPFAQVVKGYGNNGEDRLEGIFYNNIIGTYFHGPLLSKNWHIADFLIAKALQRDTLDPIDDTLVQKAFDVALRIKK